MERGHEGLSLRERQKAQTKEHLLMVATSLIAEHGFNATSIDDIAKAAGASRATVYSYFESKDAILAGIMQRMWDDANDMYLGFGNLQDWKRPTVRAWVASVFRRYAADADRNRAASDVALRAMLEQHEENHRRHVASLTKNKKLWTERFSAAQIPVRASLLITWLEHRFLNPYVQPSKASREATIDTVTDIWMDVLHAS